MKKYVAYYRVSTAKQGASGLGMESQQSIVRTFCNDSEIIAEYIEVESGKKNNRVELDRAIEYAKANNATLLIAKLDRLSRNVSFIAALMDNKVKFICCDMPEATEFTIHIFAALAEQERKLISARTKAALQAKKDRGCKLGTPANLTESARLKGLKVRQEKALNSTENKKASYLIVQERIKGTSFREIVAMLNKGNYTTSQNKPFGVSSVHKLYNRAMRV